MGHRAQLDPGMSDIFGGIWLSWTIKELDPEKSDELDGDIGLPILKPREEDECSISVNFDDSDEDSCEFRENVEQKDFNFVDRFGCVMIRSPESAKEQHFDGFWWNPIILVHRRARFRVLDSVCTSLKNDS